MVGCVATSVGQLVNGGARSDNDRAGEHLKNSIIGVWNTVGRLGHKILKKRTNPTLRLGGFGLVSFGESEVAPLMLSLLRIEDCTKKLGYFVTTPTPFCPPSPKWLCSAKR